MHRTFHSARRFRNGGKLAQSLALRTDLLAQTGAGIIQALSRRGLLEVSEPSNTFAVSLQEAEGVGSPQHACTSLTMSSPTKADANSCALRNSVSTRMG